MKEIKLTDEGNYIINLSDRNYHLSKIWIIENRYLLPREKLDLFTLQYGKQWKIDFN